MLLYKKSKMSLRGARLFSTGYTFLVQIEERKELTLSKPDHGSMQVDDTSVAEA